jgi:hypothetical protein
VIDKKIRGRPMRQQFVRGTTRPDRAAAKRAPASRDDYPHQARRESRGPDGLRSGPGRRSRRAKPA